LTRKGRAVIGGEGRGGGIQDEEISVQSTVLCTCNRWLFSTCNHWLCSTVLCTVLCTCNHVPYSTCNHVPYSTCNHVPYSTVHAEEYTRDKYTPGGIGGIRRVRWVRGWWLLAGCWTFLSFQLPVPTARDAMGQGCDGTGCDGTGCDGTGCDGTGVQGHKGTRYKGTRVQRYNACVPAVLKSEPGQLEMKGAKIQWILEYSPGVQSSSTVFEYSPRVQSCRLLAKTRHTNAPNGRSDGAVREDNGCDLPRDACTPV
jgi:hypothetical protein